MKAQILIVEDEAVVALELRQQLLDMGFEVPAAVANGDKAVAQALELRPDLVLMDIHIQGGIDGVEAARRIREQAGVPVIYLTAHADSETLARAKVTEPFGYVLKPFDRRLLQATIEIALHRQQVVRERRQQEELRRRYIARMVLTQEEERRRVARDLHDVLGQPLTSLLVKIHQTQSSSPPPPAGEPDAFEELRRDVVGILEDVKNLARGLHGVVLLDNLGLKVAIERLVEDLSGRHSTRFDVQLRGHEALDKLPVAVATSIYRILQEALNNVVQHARAENASVVVDVTDASLQLIVEDDGWGMSADLKAAGLGLYGIRERAELLGGSLTIESSREGGTALFVRVPLSGPQGEADS